MSWSRLNDEAQARQRHALEDEALHVARGKLQALASGETVPDEAALGRPGRSATPPGG